jgi:hypothetical protein
MNYEVKSQKPTGITGTSSHEGVLLTGPCRTGESLNSLF